MEPCDLIIRNAYLLTLNHQREVYERGAIAVSGVTIRDVGPERELLNYLAPDEVIDARGGLVHPGFVDAHNHIVNASCRGFFRAGSSHSGSGPNFADWKAEVTAEDEYAATALGSLQLLHNGFTAFIEPGTIFEPDAAAAAVKALGIRAGLSAPYIWDRKEILRHLGGLESRALLDRVPPDSGRARELMGSELDRNTDVEGSIHGFVCLYGLGTASDELERAAKELADAHAVVLHQHEAYEPDIAGAEEARLGHTRIVHLAELGVLDENSTFVHMNVLKDDDLVLLEQARCSIVWCPVHYLSLGLASRIRCRIPELRQRGVNVALATDSARDCIAGDAALGASLVGAGVGKAISAESILEMQTIHAAKSARLDNIIGSLEPGKRADIVIRSPYAAEAFPGLDPIHQLAFNCRTATAETVLVNGKVVLRNGQSTRVDEEEVCVCARESVRNRAARLDMDIDRTWPTKTCS